MYFGQTARSQIGGMAEELSGQSATSDIQTAKSAAGQARSEHKQKSLNSYDNSQ